MEFLASTAEPSSLRSAACPRSLELAPVLDPADKPRDVVVGTAAKAEFLNSYFFVNVDRARRWRFFARPTFLITLLLDFSEFPQFPNPRGEDRGAHLLNYLMV